MQNEQEEEEEEERWQGIWAEIWIKKISRTICFEYLFTASVADESNIYGFRIYMHGGCQFLIGIWLAFVGFLIAIYFNADLEKGGKWDIKTLAFDCLCWLLVS